MLHKILQFHNKMEEETKKQQDGRNKIKYEYKRE